MITRQQEIKKICKGLYMLWAKYPEMSLGALLTTLYGKAGKGVLEMIDIFDVDLENEIAEELTKCIR